MKVVNYFPTHFFVDTIDIDMSPIANKCLEIKSSGYPNRLSSNNGGWQSKGITLDRFVEFKQLSDLLREKFNIIGKSIHDSVQLTVKHTWINVNTRGDSNYKHNHAGAPLSAIVYVQVDNDSGRVRFYNEDSPIKHYPFRVPQQRKMFRTQEAIQPHNGMLLVFPGWIYHDVEQSQSDTDRISIAMNLHFE